MQALLIRFVINIFSLWVTTVIAQNLKLGIKVTSLKGTIYAVLLLGFFSTFIAPLLKVLTMPLTCVTLGLFVFIINGILFYVAGVLLHNHGFIVMNFWAAFWGSLIMSVISSLLDKLINVKSED